MSIRVVACVVAAIGLAACSLGGLDGFSSSGDLPGVPDGATPESGTSPTDDGGSPPPNDASTSPDAGSVDSSPGDAGVDARYCTAFSNEDYCTDFDDPTTPLATWTKSATGVSDVALASTGALSAPNAVRATAGASGGNRWAFYARNITTDTVDRARVSYALFIEQRPAGNEVEVNGVVFASAKNHEFYLAVTPSGAYIVEQSANGDGSGLQTNYHDLGNGIPTGVWLRITLDLVLSGTKELVFSVDGTELARKTLTLSAPGKPTMRAGLTWVDESANGGVVLVDDMRFDVLP